MKKLFILFACLGMLSIFPESGYAETCPGGLNPWCWGESTGLLLENEWQPYVGRPSVNGQGRFDPARMPPLTGGTGGSSRAAARSGASKVSKAATTVAVKPKDPCEEKIWQAFDEAAKAGKIPLEAVPPKPGTQAAPPAASIPPSASVQPVAPAPAVVLPSVPAAPAPPVPTAQPNAAGGVYTPYTSSVAAPGTTSQGISAPNPILAGGAPATAGQPPSVN